MFCWCWPTIYLQGTHTHTQHTCHGAHNTHSNMCTQHTQHTSWPCPLALYPPPPLLPAPRSPQPPARRPQPAAPPPRRPHLAAHRPQPAALPPAARSPPPAASRQQHCRQQLAENPTAFPEIFLQYILPQNCAIYRLQQFNKYTLVSKW